MFHDVVYNDQIPIEDRSSELSQWQEGYMHGIGRFEHQWQMDFNVQRVYQLNRFILSSVYSRSCGKVSQQVLNSGSIPRTEETTKISRHETRFAIGRYVYVFTHVTSSCKLMLWHF